MLAVVAVLGPLSAASTARAESVALLGLSSPDGEDDLARVLTGVLRARAADVSGWELLDAKPLVTQLTLAHDCEMAAASCRALIGESLGAGLVIYGSTTAAPVSGAVHVELMMFQSIDGDVVGVAARDVPRSDVEAGALATHGQALLDELRGVQKAEPEPEPDVVPGPALSPDSVELPPAPLEEAKSGGSAASWVGYGLLGASAVSAGMAVFSWTQINAAADDDNYQAYRRAVGLSDRALRVDDVCMEADAGQTYGLSSSAFRDVQDRCDSGRTYETLQYVFLGAAAVSGGVGLYLVLSDDSDGERAGRARIDLSLTPELGHRRGGVTATLRF